MESRLTWTGDQTSAGIDSQVHGEEIRTTFGVAEGAGNERPVQQKQVQSHRRLN